jgi:hypothetical protein
VFPVSRCNMVIPPLGREYWLVRARASRTQTSAAHRAAISTGRALIACRQAAIARRPVAISSHGASISRTGGPFRDPESSGAARRSDFVNPRIDFSPPRMSPRPNFMSDLGAVLCPAHFSGTASTGRRTPSDSRDYSRRKPGRFARSSSRPNSDPNRSSATSSMISISCELLDLRRPCDNGRTQN